MPQIGGQVTFDLELVHFGLVHFEVLVELGAGFQRYFAFTGIDDLRILAAEDDEVLSVTNNARMLIEIS